MDPLRRFRFWILLSAGVLCGCSTKSPENAARFRIAVIPKGTTHDFWKSIHAGAIHASRERGNCQILWEGPSKEDQSTEQQQVVERFTSEGVNALILAPCDRRTLVVPVEAAVRKKIPVVIIDSGLELTDSIQKSEWYLAYVATDNYEGGVQAVKRMSQLLQGKKHPKVLMVRYQAGSESTEQREAGFRDTMKTKPEINFIEAVDEAGATVDSAQKVGERLLSDFQDLDGIFTPNESSSNGILRAMEVQKRVGAVKLVGFDASESLIQALQADKLQGLVLQDPFDMGYQAVMRALDFLEGRPRPEIKVMHTHLQVATRENLHEPSVKSLYARDLTSYLGQ